MFGKKKENLEKSFYDKTMRDNARKTHNITKTSLEKGQTEAQSELYWKIPSIAIPVGIWIAICIFLQYTSMLYKRIVEENQDIGYFHGNALIPWYFILGLIGLGISIPYARHKFRAVWKNNNAQFIQNDLHTFENDSYLRTVYHMARELEFAPDAGLGYDGHASTLLSHIMVDNKGIKKIDMPVYDPSVPGQIAVDENGNIKTEKLPMFNKEFGNVLFDFSNVPPNARKWYNATELDYNPIQSKKDGGDGKKRVGGYGRKHYDTLADYINGEFYPLAVNSERPAGVYVYDPRPVNTILVAITRGGKGQTYIEPAIDTWAREKNKWNLFSTDPKGGAPRSIVKSYSLAA